VSAHSRKLSGSKQRLYKHAVGQPHQVDIRPMLPQTYIVNRNILYTYYSHIYFINWTISDNDATTMHCDTALQE
jgi:hypothetical protein